MVISRNDLAAIAAGLLLDNLQVSDPSSTVAISSTPQGNGPQGDGPQGGILASRLIQDWFAGFLVQEDQPGMPPTECPAMRIFPPHPNAGTDHDLIIIPSQSWDASYDPEGKGSTLLSCMCRYCRYHFAFRIDPGDPEVPGHLQHHIREWNTEWYRASLREPTPASKTWPSEGKVSYFCTLCRMGITLDMTLPRLKPDWLRLITDEARIRANVRRAKLEDPGRYADATPARETHYATTALTTLNQYLKNILEDDGEGPNKRISFRNKTFYVQFGQACESIFRYLEFEEAYDENTKDSYWVPPRLTRQEGKTPLGSDKAFFEDVRTEVQSVLDEKPPIDGQPVVTQPKSARDQMEKALGCDKIPHYVDAPRPDSNEARHFRTLGAPVDADDETLKFAYEQQVHADPQHASIYVEALGGLSARRSMELQMFVFKQQETLDKQHGDKVSAAANAGPTEKAYAHFGLSSDCPEKPAYFIGVYRNYREQSPAQRSEHRLALLQIGRDRQSDEILNEVYSTKMELSEACQFLGVEPEWPMDSIAAMAQSVASEMDVDLLILALDSVSSNRPADDPNRASFETIFTELRSSRQLQLLATGVSLAGITDSGRGDVDAPQGSRETVDMELPVGLGNLRNTCYLNSILQYFYSVNAVRDLALNSHLPALEPTETNLSHVLRSNSGGSSSSQSELETGRAFVGHEFTRELSTLFRELDGSGDSSVSPRQRLANAALLRPEKLRPRSVETKAASDSGMTDAPPLPPRASESSNTGVPIAPMIEVEPSETASAASSQTLIGDTPVVTTIEQSTEEDAVMMVDGPDDQKPSVSATGRPSEGEAKMSKLTVEELAVELDKPNVGSDQMDVDEVMGNAIDHLRAAFTLAQVDRPGAGPDPIKQAFFSTFIDNRKKIGESAWNRTSRLDRWVTAYPAQSGTRDLYDALANSFDLEPLPGDLLSFTTIERPAPHFHVCIQRSDGIRKNANPVAIPETLYLDRFMHTADTQSTLSKTRKRGWDVKTRLNETATASATESSGAAKAAPLPIGPAKPNTQDDDLTDEVIDGFLVIGDLGDLDGSVQEPPSSVTNNGNGSPETDDSDMQELFDKYGFVEIENPQSTTPEPPQRMMEDAEPLPPADLDQFWEKFVAEENTERDRLTAERDRIFGSCHDVAYRLHAVVCHAGSSAAAGHYWVWIHDFERDVWRKYNDTAVSVHPPDFVFSELNSKGEPYYLAYVRADEVQNLVSVPRRRQRTPPAVPPRSGSADVTEDVVMADADNNDEVAVVEHLESVEVLPPAYSA